MEMAEVPSPQSPLDAADRGIQDEGNPGPSESQVMYRTPYRILVLEDGLHTWDGAHCNRDRGSAGLKAEVEAVAADPGRRGYYSEQLMDGQIVMVKKCPTEIKTKENVRDWLQW